MGRVERATRGTPALTGRFSNSEGVRRPQCPRVTNPADTDKQKRKAAHIEKGYEERGIPKTKPSAAPGRRSTRKAAVGTRAAPAAARRTIIPPPRRAVSLVARIGSAIGKGEVGLGQKGSRDTQEEKLLSFAAGLE